MPLTCRHPEITIRALSQVNLTATIGGSDTSWQIRIRVWMLRHYIFIRNKIGMPVTIFQHQSMPSQNQKQ
jgi:hypothetical protein